MAEDIGVEVKGDRQVALKFDEFPGRARDSLLRHIKSLTGELAARVRAMAPHGQTGKLGSSIEEQIFDDSPQQISGRITVDEDFAKAGALEWGAHRSFRVKAHRQKLDHAWSRRMAAPKEVMVEAYSRQANIAQRRFLRDPLETMSGEIVADLREAVEEAEAANP